MKKKNIIIVAIVVLLAGILFYNNQMNSRPSERTKENDDINKYNLTDFFGSLEAKYEGILSDDNQNKLLPTEFQDEEQKKQSKSDLEEMKERLANYDYETDEESDKFLDMNHMGQLYQIFGQWDEALLVYNQATQEFSDSDLAWFNLGSYNIDMGNWSSGIDAVNTSIIMDNDNILYWRYAIDFYVEKLKIDREDTEALFELAKHYTNNAEDILNKENIYLEGINKS